MGRLKWDLPEDVREQYSYRDNNGNWHLKPETSFDDVARYVKFPAPTSTPASLRYIANELADMKGYKQTSKSILSNIKGLGDNDRVNLNGARWDKVVPKLRQLSRSKDNAVYRADHIAELFKSQDRLVRMGIKGAISLRQALREYEQANNGKITTRKEVTRLKQLEDAVKDVIRGNRNAFNDFFPTPETEAKELIELADIQSGMKVLEPNAGMGHLADLIAEKDGVSLDVGELAGSLREILNEKGHNVVSDDFLDYQADETYDRVVMNPPFSHDADIHHITHALKMLKPGGRLVAITSSMAGERGNSANKNFREYLDAVGAVEELHPEGAFKSSLNPTGVRTKMIVIDKPVSSDGLPSPDDIRFSKTSVVGTKLSMSIDPTKALEEANQFIAGYEGFKGINVTVLDTQDQLKELAQTDPGSKIKGVWLSGDNRVVLVAENITNSADLRKVLRHELIAHNGLYANLSKSEAESLTNKVLKLSKNLQLAPIFMEVNRSYSGAPKEVIAEEVIARVAEDERSTLERFGDRIMSYVMSALRNSGLLSKDRISVSEIRTMINEVDSFLRNSKGLLRESGVVRFAKMVKEEDFAQMDLGNPTVSYQDAIKEDQSNFYKSLLGKLPKSLKSSAIYDAAKGNGWGLLTLRQIVEVGKAKVSAPFGNILEQYLTVVNKKMARQNVLLNEVADVSEDMRQWIRKGNKEQAQQLFDFMHEATLENVDPSRDYQDMTALLTDMIAIKEEQLRGRGGESNVELTKELNQYRNDLKYEGNRRKKHAKLKKIYDGLSKDQKMYFGRVRDHYSAQQDRMFDALVEKAAKLSLSGTGVSDRKMAMNVYNRLMQEFGKTHADKLGKLGSEGVALEFAMAKKGYYVPLARFGDYWVSTKWDTGKRVGSSVEVDSQYEMFESEAEMMERVEQLTSAGFKPKYGKKIEESGLVSGATMGFVTDMMNKINEANIQNKARDQLKDDLYQLFLQSLPDRSIRKSFIHRKGIKGYSENVLRVMAEQGFKQSRQQVRLETEDDLNAILTGLNDAAKNEPNNVSAQRIADEMNKRHEWISDPKRAKWAQKLTGLGFFMMIGASPASALMNLTQNIQVALPVIGSKFGYSKTFVEMNKLTGMWVKNRYASSKDQKTKNKYGVLGSLLTGDEKEAMRMAIEQGTIDVTQTSDALSLAESPDAAFGDWKDRVNRALGWTFHNAEVLNREITFMTAYRLAKNDGMSLEAAYSYANKATWDSHFDYGSLNRARFMQSDIAAVALQFKQYSQNMTYYLISTSMKAMKKGALGKAASKEDVSKARREILGVMAMTFSLGGLSALPIGTLAAIANMVHAAVGDDDEPWDAEVELRSIISEWFGKEWASAMYNGVPPSVGLPAIGSRINIDFLDMWVRESNAENASGTVADIGAQMFGPAGGIVTNAARGFDYMTQGRNMRAAEMFMPKWVKDILKVNRYLSEGGNVTNRNGEILVADLSPLEYSHQLLGFTPTRLAHQYEANRAIKGYEKKVSYRRSLLLNQMWVSYSKGDKEEIANIWRHIAHFNKSRWGKLNPISSDTVKRSISKHLKLQGKATNGIIFNDKYTPAINDKFFAY